MPEPIVRILVGIVAAGLIALLAHRVRFLGASGAWATFVLGALVFGTGGVPWSVPLITFFVLSSILSRFGPRRKRMMAQRLERVFEKGSTRDAGQVAANGGVAGIIALANLIAPSPLWFTAYLGSLAAAAADTWATEIGVLATGRTISIVGFSVVEPGTSGGISLPGTLGALAGACSVALAGMPWGDLPLGELLVVTTAGVIGMLADSLAGASVQARYRCETCGLITEQRMHCGGVPAPVAGRAWITNDVVNVLCCAVGALAAALGLLLPCLRAR
ncbi:MAG: DUF92 domain-containing protein [Bacteroidetes bacterium]|nr:DUF92 domain-containing protein [Bacteroidota bacterium]